MTSYGTSRRQKSQAYAKNAPGRPRSSSFLLTLILTSLFTACAHQSPRRSPSALLHAPTQASLSATMPTATQPTTATTQPTTATTQPTTATLATATSQAATSQPASVPTSPKLAPVVRCGLPQGGHVALTFDDGPYRSRGQTRRILAILRRAHVKATFFVLGRLARRYPELLRQIHDEGHLIANHSWDHPRRQTRAGWISQLTRTDRAIRAAGVTPSRYYRPPHGITNTLVRRLCAKLGYTIVLYTVLSSDWRRPGVAPLVRQVTRRLRDGGIVVLHDGGGNRTQTIEALPGIIRGLRARGLEPVRLDRLLEGGAKRRGCTRQRKQGKKRWRERREERGERRAPRKREKRGAGVRDVDPI